VKKADEVALGEAQEVPILRSWVKLSPYARGVHKWRKSVQFADYDFVGWTKDAIPITFVEVKGRRSEWGKYGDVIFPWRKHRLAKRLTHINVPLIGVTRYACGTIVEVNLQDDPDDRVALSRRDRPGMAPVWHAVYREPSLVVYAP
jgi:hypothetical protein